MLKKFLAGKIADCLDLRKDRQLIESLVFFPEKNEFGDASIKCFALAGKLEKKPDKVAALIKQKLEQQKEFEKIEAVGAYTNFWIAKKFLIKNNFAELLEKEAISPLKLENEKIMIEFSQPNPNKPMHLGHLRNDFIGMAASSMNEFIGNKVIKANLINDRGIHVTQMMTAYKNYGNNETPEQAELKPDHFIGKYYVLFQQKAKEKPELNEEAQEMLRLWESNDKKTRGLWKKLVNYAISGFKETYKTIGSRFDEWFFESDYYDKTRPLIELGLKQKVFYRDEEGAIKVKLGREQLPDKTVLRADGTSIYFTNDLALTKHKFDDFKIDKSYWVVASEQNLYFKQLFAAFKELGLNKIADNCRHLSYGLVLLPEGKMKSREGKVIDADNLIKELGELAKKELIKRNNSLSKKELEKRSLIIALASIKFFLLNHEMHKDIMFEKEKILSFEGHTGAYLLYSYARARSIQRKAGIVEKKEMVKALDESELGGLELQLLKRMSLFQDIMGNAGKKLELNTACNYLLELAADFNAFYSKVPVIQAEEKEKKARIALIQLFVMHLKKGLELLNIQALEEM